MINKLRSLIAPLLGALVVMYIYIKISEDSTTGSVNDRDILSEAKDYPFHIINPPIRNPLLNWVQINGGFEGNRTRSKIMLKFPREKILNYKTSQLHKSNKPPETLETQLIEIGDDVTFASPWGDNNRSFKVNNILFSNSLEYIVIEVTDINESKSHFYLTNSK